jgi:hypothetical protein
MTDPQLESWKLNHTASVSSGAEAVKTALLINGGAAIAVLAFIGGIASQGRISTSDINDVAGGLSWFGYGVLSAAVTMGLAYLTNRAILSTVGISSKIRSAVSGLIQLLTVAAFITSIVLFAFGLFDVRTSIGKLKFIEPPKTPAYLGPG